LLPLEQQQATTKDLPLDLDDDNDELPLLELDNDDYNLNWFYDLLKE